MIGVVRGILDHRGASPVLVHCASGVGYEVHVPDRLLSRCRAGDEITLYTVQVVRENAIELFGFLDAHEKAMFQLLCKVPKVGSRTAQAVLGVLDANELIDALVNMDTAQLTRVPGIGKKTAERMLVELRDLAPGFATPARTSSAAPREEAVAALRSLGFAESDARKRVGAVLERDPDISLDRLIREALAG